MNPINKALSLRRDIIGIDRTIASAPFESTREMLARRRVELISQYTTALKSLSERDVYIFHRAVTLEVGR